MEKFYIIALIVYFFLNGVVVGDCRKDRYPLKFRGLYFVGLSLFGIIFVIFMFILFAIKEGLFIVDDVLCFRFSLSFLFTKKYDVISKEFFNKILNIKTKNPIKTYWCNKVINKYKLQNPNNTFAKI